MTQGSERGNCPVRALFQNERISGFLNCSSVDGCILAQKSAEGFLVEPVQGSCVGRPLVPLVTSEPLTGEKDVIISPPTDVFIATPQREEKAG